MKKFAALLALCLLLSAAGCGGAAAPAATPAPAEETASPAPTDVPVPEETPAESAKGQIITEIRRESETFLDDDGITELLSYASALPVVTIPGNRAAEEKINAALRAEQELFVNGDPDLDGLSGTESFLAAAGEDLAWRRSEGFDGEFYPYAMERAAVVSRSDARVLTITFSDYYYSGGAHGGTAIWSMNFDAATGEQISITDLAEDTDAFLSGCVQRLWETSRDGDHAGYIDAYYPGYEDSLPGLLRDQLWYFSEEGLTVVANQYEIAPYAAGPIELTVPYEWLSWQMKEEYLPPEDEADGELTGVIADDPGDCLYTADDGTDGQGACVVLTARGSVKDLRIARAGYSEYSDIFYENGDLLSVSRLEDGESICVRTWIPDVLPALKLIYTDGTGEKEFLISQSGRDGSLVLMDARPYTALPAEIGGRLPFVYDLDGDGENETIDLVPENAEEGAWKITVDGESLGDVVSVDRASCTLWLADVDSNGVPELIFSGDLGSDDYVTSAWRGDTLEPLSFTGENRRGANPWTVTSTVDGRAVLSAWQLYIASWSYQLGTYRAVRPYTLADGVFSPGGRGGWTYDTNDFYLVVKRDLPVILDDGAFKMLPPGTAILLTGTEGNIVRFTSANDVAGTILLEYVLGDNGGWYINGLSENEYFEMLPYAG